MNIPKPQSVYKHQWIHFSELILIKSLGVKTREEVIKLFEDQGWYFNSENNIDRIMFFEYPKTNRNLDMEYVLRLSFL